MRATARPRSSRTSRAGRGCGRCGIGSTTTTATGSRSCTTSSPPDARSIRRSRRRPPRCSPTPSLSGPTRDAVIDIFIRELQTIAPQGAILIFDDFHLVDDAPDVQLIARELVARAPERLTIVFASRRSPGIPMLEARDPPARSPNSRPTTCDSMPTRPSDSSARPTAERSTRTSSPMSPRGPRAGRHRCNSSTPRCETGRPARSARSSADSPAPTTTCTTTSPRRWSATSPRTCRQFLMRTSILQVVTPELAEVVTGLDAGDRAAPDGRRRTGHPAWPAGSRPANGVALPPARAGLPGGSARPGPRDRGGPRPAPDRRGARRGLRLADRRSPPLARRATIREPTTSSTGPPKASSAAASTWSPPPSSRTCPSPTNAPASRSSSPAATSSAATLKPPSTTRNEPCADRPSSDVAQANSPL